MIMKNKMILAALCAAMACVAMATLALPAGLRDVAVPASGYVKLAK